MKIGKLIYVGKFKCTLTFDTEVSSLRAVWDPDVPEAGDLTPEDLNEYRAGRDALLADAAKYLGQILVLE